MCFSFLSRYTIQKVSLVLMDSNILIHFLKKTYVFQTIWLDYDTTHNNIYLSIFMAFDKCITKLQSQKIVIYNKIFDP